MMFFEQLRSCWLLAAFGSILYAFSIGILFWNEGRAVSHSLSLDEVLDQVITVRADDLYDNKLEGRLIHIAGPLITGEPLTEPDYGIQVLAVKLRRRVQMYQWVEDETQTNFDHVVSVQTEERTYYYTQDWKDRLIDSSGFYIRSGHQNPTSFPIESRMQIADHVNIGYYELGDEVKNKVTQFAELTSDTRPDDPAVKLHSGLYYHCNDMWNPEMGDLRIQFTYAGLEGTKYTVVGQVRGGKVMPYQTAVNVYVLLVYEGEHTLAATFKAAHYTYKLTTWAFRFGGWLLLFFAITCTSSLLHTLLSQNQLFWSVAPDPRHPVSGNLLLSLSIALIITSIAWIFQRPWLGGSMIVAAVSPFIYFARGIAHYQRVPYE